MLGAMLILMQSIPVAPPPLPTAGPVLPKALSVVSSCDPSDTDIVVCGKIDPDQYRVRPLGPPPNGKPLSPMTAKLGNGTIDGRAKERCVGGFCAPALMGTIKLPF
ncbi:hypothetical protein FPZ24_02255 [Sphingomonas panacisoli]|uniref:Uncharacterized protein n=1 Tax=Sphingomonas panacisoli TaxID=1813879 RepID=A0A5B8LEE5_9SPHN|nr:hypothetical protein [Sphingomonas panacisoli]QDZ06441.1 hypothetical protein FPZ24_02255 [Sphingomonas panacisoli]